MYGKHEYLLLCTTLRVVSLHITETGRPVTSGTLSCQLCQGFRMAVTWWGHHVTGLGSQRGKPRHPVFSSEGIHLSGLIHLTVKCLTCYQETEAQRI